MKQKPFHGESFYLTGTPFIILHLSFTANKKMKLNIILISDIFLFAVAEGKIQKNYEPPASTNISNSWRAGNPSD